MCIGFIKVATSPNEKYKLILLNNRDEDLDRPTSKIHWHDGILSGVDEKDVARGTWLGEGFFKLQRNTSYSVNRNFKKSKVKKLKNSKNQKI
ncbi:hypothetical protein B9Z55_021687 [Caenorhabditis nigoni]|uniref:Uncharacterized protein n=1 Tax=Caenorhabditis nigoni TaxID=1611254 RepID=A0A2G5TTM9_9PELO|nr:hypothetical protein B9Z55_021687 [Caenorhabditis nigoni]